MKEKMNRRNFIKKSGVGIGFASIVGAKDLIKSPESDMADKIPMRKLGRTGKMVSCLGFGGGSRYLIPDEKTAEKLIQYAFNLGITFFDTSLTYGDGKSESRYGKYLIPFHRDEIFLSTKTDALTYDVIMKDIEQSLKNLKTDYVDLYSFHLVNNAEKVKKISGSNGALEGAVKLRDEGIIKAIGISFHEWSNVSKEAIKKFDPDVVICPLNAARSYGYGDLVDKSESSEENLLPYAKKNNIGIAAIKTTGQ
ncbi:aldo/keto reductase, partial [bacterium]|nr:aldo/keto reductase [bacterium]